MSDYIVNFSPVNAVRIKKGWWIVRTPDRRLAWFGNNPFELIRRAQAHLKGEAI